MPRMQHENKPVLSFKRKYSINTNANLWRSMLVKTRENTNDTNSMVCTYDCVLHLSNDSLFSK